MTQNDIDTDRTEQREFTNLDRINSLDGANEAVRQGMLLRVQPPAPKATRYYGRDENGWLHKKAGHKVWRQVSTESVREAAKRALEDGGGVHCLYAADIEKIS